MVLPAIIAGGAFAARFLIPRLLPIAAKAGRFILPKTLKGAVFQAVAVPTAIGLFTGSKTAREVVTTTLDPRTGFERGRDIGERIEGLEKPEKEKLIGAAAAAGLVGVGLAGAAIVIPKVIAKVKAPKETGLVAEKPITPETQIIQTQPKALRPI